MENIPSSKNETRFISVDVMKILYQKDGFAVVEGTTPYPFKPAITRFSISGLGDWVPEGRIRVQGRIIEHEKHGREFKCWYCAPKKPTIPPEHQKLLDDLANGKVPGIGQGTAQRIIDLIGHDLNSVIANPQSLTGISGIGLKKAEMIAAMFERSLNHANCRTK